MAEATADNGKVTKKEYDGKVARNPDGALMEIPPLEGDNAWTTSYKPLGKKDFGDESLWMDWKIKLLEHKLVKAKKDKEEYTLYGSPEKRKATKRFSRVLDQLNALESELKAMGLNPDQIKATLK